MRDLAMYIGNDQLLSSVQEKFSGLKNKICMQAQLESENNTRLRKLISKTTITGELIPCVVLQKAAAFLWL